jgi:hypothetical protein
MKPRSSPFFIFAAAGLFLPSQAHAAYVVLSSAAIGSGDNDANVGLGNTHSVVARTRLALRLLARFPLGW